MRTNSGPSATIRVPFTVDSALLRELGERLVGKPEIALAELVKNSYDADALECRIRFGPDEIEIVDDGHGMTEDEFKAFWMRVGTTNKQRQHESRIRRRPLTGSKGVGRLASQFLARSLTLSTASATDPSRVLTANIDWSDAVTAGELTEAYADYAVAPREETFARGSINGTRIRLVGLNSLWNEESVRALAQELWLLQSPLAELAGDEEDRDGFLIVVDAKEKIRDTFEKQIKAALDNWQAALVGEVKNGRHHNRVDLTLWFRDGERFKVSYPMRHGTIDRLKFVIRIFKAVGRQPMGIKVSDLREYLEKYGGIHVYDSKFRLPYYGEREQDWLGIERDHAHRLFNSKLLPKELHVDAAMRELPTTSRLFGVVAISTGHESETAPPVVGQDDRRSPHLQIQVTRDRLVENEAYEDLCYAVRWSIDYYATRVRMRRLREQEAKRSSQTTAERLGRVYTVLSRYESSIPDTVYRELETEIVGAVAAEKAEERARTGASALLGALATAGMAAIAIEHEIGKELTALENLVDQIEGEFSDTVSGNDISSEMVEQFRSWIDRVRSTRAMFSPLMNETDRKERHRYSAAVVLDQVSRHSVALLRGIEVDVSDVSQGLRLPEASMAEWNAIFQNLFVNAVNAMLDSTERRIVCSGECNNNQGRLLVQDFGVGVDVHTAEELFQPFERRIEISNERRALGLGGVGLGLTIVRLIADGLGCGTAFVTPRSPYSTAFQLSWEGCE